MLRMEWHLALVVIVFAPIPALIGARAAPEQMRRERRLVERWSSIYSPLQRGPGRHDDGEGLRHGGGGEAAIPGGVREGNDVVRRGVRTDNLTGTLRNSRRHHRPARRTGAGWLLRGPG